MVHGEQYTMRELENWAELRLTMSGPQDRNGRLESSSEALFTSLYREASEWSQSAAWRLRKHEQ